MKVYNIAVLEGDGIGPEVMKEALKLLDVISKKNNVKFDCIKGLVGAAAIDKDCLLYTSPSPRDRTRSRMPSSA